MGTEPKKIDYKIDFSEDFIMNYLRFIEFPINELKSYTVKELLGFMNAVYFDLNTMNDQTIIALTDYPLEN